MQLRKKPEFPLQSLTNDSNSLPDFTVLDSPSAPEDSKNLLPDNRELVPLIPKKLPDAANKKTHDFFKVIFLKKAPNVSKNQGQGNPLIECLIAFFVLGILGAIALPSLMSCTNKSKHAETKQNVGAMNRAQQAYYLENKTFSNSLESLSLGIRTPTVNYEYSTRATKTAAFTYGIGRKETKTIKSYVGGVFVVPATNLDAKADKKEMTTVSIMCEAISPGNTRPSAPTLQKGFPTCGTDTKDLSR